MVFMSLNHVVDLLTKDDGPNSSSYKHGTRGDCDVAIGVLKNLRERRAKPSILW